MDRWKIKGSPMIILKILAMSFSILQYSAHAVRFLVCAIFNLNPRKILVCPRASSMAALWKIRVGPRSYPRVPVRNNHRIPWKKLSFPWFPFVMYCSSIYWYGGFLQDCQTVIIKFCQFFSYMKAIHLFFLQNYTNLCKCELQ